MRLLVAIGVSALFLLPIVLAAAGGLKSQGELILHPLGFPTHPQWSNYSNVLTKGPFWTLMKNSFIIMIAVTLGVVTFCSTAAYLFARLQFKGRETLFNYIMLGLFFPMAVAVLPLFVTLRKLHLTDHLLGVILVEVAFAIPTSLLLLRSFFVRSVPFELQEAAYLDGCSELTFFLRILLPMARPPIAAVAVITMVTSWNIYFLPLLVMNSPSKYTLPLGVAQFQGTHGTDWPSTMAFVTLSLVPTIVFYLMAERHLVGGLTAGALKG